MNTFLNYDYNSAKNVRQLRKVTKSIYLIYTGNQETINGFINLMSVKSVVKVF